VTPDKKHEGCLCCGRRDFIAAVGLGAGTLALSSSSSFAPNISHAATIKKGTAVVKGAFIYTPSEQLYGKWWSWPGIDFDAEGRHKKYMAGIKRIERDLGMHISIPDKPLYDDEGVSGFIEDVKRSNPDGVLLIPLFNFHFSYIDKIVASVVGTPDSSETAIPTVIFTCLGVHHGSIKKYQRRNVDIIQSLDNMDALDYAMRMIKTRRLMKESRIISVAGQEPRKLTVPFWGTEVVGVTLPQFVEEVKRMEVTDDVRKLARDYVRNAKKTLEPKEQEILTAAKVHFANKRILEAEGGDAIMMDCLRRGEYMPCMSFMTLRDEGIPAGCENDLSATLTLMLAQYLFNRPGFQHNPCFETEVNHYFASHCTSASKLFGVDKPSEPYLLRNYAHTNDPTCVPQVLWREGEDVTMAHCLEGDPPTMLVYSGQVVKWYNMPPVGGCRTNVEITINELEDACDVKGHHNVLFYGDFARDLRRFARFCGVQVAT